MEAIPLEPRFSKKKLERLYTRGVGARDYPEGVVDSFLLRVRTIEQAKDERDLRALASLHFEKLKGKYAGCYSVRLRDRWRLILKIVTEEKRKIVIIDELSQHYGD